MAEAAVPPPVVTLTVAAVARRLGVAPPTLRTWDRRYGLGPSAHTAGAHRRYSSSDVARLMVMRQLTLEGVSPADAAAIAIATPSSADSAAAAYQVIPQGFGRSEDSDPEQPAPDDAERGGGRLRLAPFVDFSPTAPLPADPSPTDQLLGDPLLGDPLLSDPLLADPLLADPLLADPLLAGPLQSDRLPAGPLPTAPLPTAPLPTAPPPTAPPPTGSAQGPFAAVDLASARLAEAFDSGPGPGPGDGPWRPEPGPQHQLGWLSVLRPDLERGGAGGGRVIALPDGTPATRGLARAAMSLDTYETNRLLRDAIRIRGVVRAWNELIMPVLRALGERTSTTGDGIDVEHAFSEVIMGVMRAATLGLYQPRRSANVLLACADADYHSLPLHALAAALAEREIGTRMLGSGLPPHALSASVRRTGPSAVVLFARMPGADAAATDELRRQRPTPTVILAGPGWKPGTVPSFARRAASLSEAIDEVVRALHA